jgi:hypothetical protein
MKEQSEKFELNNKQSTHLLKLALEPDNESNEITPKNRSDLLINMLSSKLPVNPALFESLPDVLKPMSEELESVSGLPLGKLILDSQTSITLLTEIKDYTKQLGATAPDNIQRDSALAIYYAAIAAALVFHKERISRYSYKQLGQSFHKLCKNDWIGTDLTGLYKKAIDYCSSEKR